MSTATLDTAMYWVDHNVSVIPLLPKSKLPMDDWRKYQTSIPTQTQLKRWFGYSERNMGIVCGGNENLVVLDFDAMPGYIDFVNQVVAKSKAWNYVFKNSYKVKTHRGVHLYVKTLDKTRSRKLLDSHIDIRSNGNMVVAPPSIHPSGSLYREINQKVIQTVETISDIFPEIIYRSQQNSNMLIPKSNSIDFMDEQYNQIPGRVGISVVKQNIPILDFVSRYREVKRTSADGRWWMSKCIHPSHNDHNPSFRIDTVKNRATCLSGHCPLSDPIGLDIIDLYVIMFNQNKKEAIRYLVSLFC